MHTRTTLPGRRRLAAMSAATCASLLLILVPSHADAKAASASCASLLPAVTPAVFGTQESTWSYPVRNIDAINATVTLRLEDPIDVAILGTLKENQVSFQLPIDRLPEERKINYAVEVGTDKIQCTTRPAALSFVISDLSPTEALDLPWHARRNFIHSAAQAFIYSAGRAGLLTASTDPTDIATLCKQLFPAPTPCDWAPGESRKQVGEDALSPSPELEVRQRKTTGARSAAEADAALCRTIRLRNIPEDAGYWYWGDFVIEEPGPLTPFTTSRAQADKTDQDHNRINLFSEVSRNTSGVATTKTYGNVGFHLRFGSNSTASITINPTLSYSTHGRHLGFAWRPIPPWPGTSSAEARFRINAYSKNVTQGQTLAGGNQFDKITPVADGLGFDTADESFDVNSKSVSLPAVDVTNGDVLRFYVRGNAKASAEAIGPTGAEATSNVSEEPTDVNDSIPDNRFVQADHVDLQLTDPDYYWVDTSRCVGYW